MAGPRPVAPTPGKDADNLPILQVALASRLRQTFDYLAPAGGGPPAGPGMRVLVPLGRRRVVGFVMGLAAESSLPTARLKRAIELLDEAPLWDEATFALLAWAARYYHIRSRRSQSG